MERAPGNGGTPPTFGGGEGWEKNGDKQPPGDSTTHTSRSEEAEKRTKTKGKRRMEE